MLRHNTALALWGTRRHRESERIQGEYVSRLREKEEESDNQKKIFTIGSREAFFCIFAPGNACSPSQRKEITTLHRGSEQKKSGRG